MAYKLSDINNKEIFLKVFFIWYFRAYNLENVWLKERSYNQISRKFKLFMIMNVRLLSMLEDINKIRI
jgi:hypothetical protein